MKHKLFGIIAAMTFSGSVIANNDLTGKHLFCADNTNNNSSTNVYGISFISKGEVDIKTLRDEWRESSSDIIIKLKDSLFGYPVHKRSYIAYEVDNRSISIIRSEGSDHEVLKGFFMDYRSPMFTVDRKSLKFTKDGSTYYQCELTNSENLGASINESAKLVKERHENLRKGNKI
jgi:hypothetical protein